MVRCLQAERCWQQTSSAVCVCVCVRACVRACVFAFACLRVCVFACLRVCGVLYVWSVLVEVRVYVCEIL